MVKVCTERAGDQNEFRVCVYITGWSVINRLDSQISGSERILCV